MTNIQVINNWISGNDAHNSSGGSSSSSLRSVDGVLYSYNLKIAERSQAFQSSIKWYDVYDYDIDNIERVSGYRSMTTRQHLGLVKRTLTSRQMTYDVHTWDTVSYTHLTLPTTPYV